VWQARFNGRAGSRPNPRQWRLEFGARRGQLQYFTPSGAGLDGAGHLVITARRQLYTDVYGVTRGFTSASLETEGRFQAKYGLLEARIKIPSGKGLWPGFWALGADYNRVGWPQSGEIDIMENAGENPSEISGSIHGPEDDVSDGYAIHRIKRTRVSLADGFHDYGVIWSPGRILFTLDGRPYGAVTPKSLARTEQWVFDKPFFLILSLAIAPEGPNQLTRLPARLLVDWVRVYR
jgi:beta-glucanase (GH16 family)